MSQTLLATKTFLPSTQANLVSRPRLSVRLDEIHQPQCRLLLISAPAGSGKSTLVASWASDQKIPTAWLSLDAEDNDLIRFWTYVIFAIQTRLAGACQALLEELRANQPPAMADLLPRLINALAELPPGLTLVLDDYHVIQNSAIHENLAFFLDHLPPGFRLVIVTRSDPALPVHRWRARGQLIELRALDLRFTLQEAEKFLNGSMGLHLQADEINQLGERTEGWAVGLQLAGLSLQGREDTASFIQRFSGSHHFVLEYLTNEALLQQQPEIQEFLLQTSILDQLCVPLCQAVTAREDCAQLLDTLKQQNVFVISLDDENYWFRYHHLFSDLLRMRLARGGADRLRRLHDRAAHWYQDNGLIDQSLDHALKAGNDEFAADLVNRSWRQAVHAGRLKDSLKWLESLPQEKVAQSALLSAAFAWTLWLIGRTNQVEPYVEQANRAYEKLSAAGQIPPDNYEYSSLPGQMSAIQALTAARKGDLAGAIAYADRAIQLSPPLEALARGLALSALGFACRESGDFPRTLEAYQQSLPYSFGSGNIMAAAAVIASIARVYTLQGNLSAAEATHRQALQAAEERGMAGMPAYGLCHAGLAELAYERNDLEQVRLLLERAQEQGRMGGYADLVKNVAVLQARLKRMEGDLQSALELLEGAAQFLLQKESMLLYREVQSWIARFSAEMGDVRRAVQWFEKLKISLDRDPGLTYGIELLNAAYLLAALRRLPEADALLVPLERAAQQAGTRGRELEALALHAGVLAQFLCYIQKRQKTPAMDNLHQTAD